MSKYLAAYHYACLPSGSRLVIPALGDPRRNDAIREWLHIWRSVDPLQVDVSVFDAPFGGVCVDTWNTREFDTDLLPLIGS